MASFPSLEVSAWGIGMVFLLSSALALYRFYFSKRARRQPRSQWAQVFRIALFLLLLLLALGYLRQLREMSDFIQRL